MTDWQAVVDQHSALVWRTAYRLLGNSEDAADCVQETFLAALDVARRQPVRNWPGLLGQLCTRRALDQLRRRLRQQQRYEEPCELTHIASNQPGPEQEAQQADLSSLLREMLARLPPRQAEVFCLRFVNELSYREIAREMDITTPAVGVLLQRARAQLRELMKPHVSEPKPEARS